MPTIFVSYRREDAAAHAGRLSDRLGDEFGTENIVLDIDVAPGKDFADPIGKALAASDVMLVLIGPQWGRVADRSGRRRIDDPADFVRREIATALKRRIPVIPVLVGEADFPDAEFFPPEIRELHNFQSIRLRDQEWTDDVNQLVEVLIKIASRGSDDSRKANLVQTSFPSSPFVAQQSAPAPEVSRSRQATASADLRPDETDQRDIFISYVEEDGATASKLAQELRGQHQSTWTYEEDGVPGVSYLTQVFRAIDSCRAVVLIASATSIRARQVIKEVEAAHERDKMLIAVRVGLTHQELTAADEILRMAIGTAVTLPLDQRNVAGTAKRIANALRLASQQTKT